MLSDYLAKQSYAVVASYLDDELFALVAGVRFLNANQLELHYPKHNPFILGQKITLHLDNRTGAEYYDQDLRVFRTSVKALIRENSPERSIVDLEEYELVYSNKKQEVFRAEGFQFTQDKRPILDQPYSDIKLPLDLASKEFGNKLGVLVSRGPDQPHTTVMAFLSSSKDDIFIISQAATLKSHNLARDSRCLFAIDHRNTYNFEKAYDWNYSIIKGMAHQVEKTSREFSELQAEFVRKNPWEEAFFTDPSIIMYHIKPEEVLCPDKFKF